MTWDSKSLALGRIAILGQHHSGTTWLANILANHPRVVAVQSDDHFGVHESIFFSHFARAYGDIADEANFRRFAADFATSDYYILTGLEADWLLRRRPRSYAEAFRAVMDEMARRRDGDVWIEKSPQHTLLGEELAAAFPDARFVAILRRAHAVINSHVWLGGEPPLYIGRPPQYPARLVRLAKLCAVYALHDRWLRRFCRPRARCLLVTYESLTADPTEETARACEFLGIPFESSMLDLPWRKNTSKNSPGKAIARGGGPNRGYVCRQRIPSGPASAAEIRSSGDADRAASSNGQFGAGAAETPN
jgi:hypothetical protein